ncbi:MAG: TIGR00282 family metallophosphoesterase [Candidatus Omnitrophica bacterium]|nr:TIGR00282 family metallophosphoesterase [Candidatus Omnitrophota bacterium]
MKILVLGDTVGKPGRKACSELIPKVIAQEQIDFVVVNGENLAAGSGITKETVDEIFSAGADVITTGDHVFKKKEANELVVKDRRIVRPLNYHQGTLGKGSTIVTAKNGVRVGVVNLLGRVFLKPIECPFRTVEKELETLGREARVILVDMHAEATSEKVAMGWFLDGKVSAVFGTHTHIQTSDETILPYGTAYITELGMCGPYESVIGRRVDQVLKQFLTQIPTHLDVAEEDARISGAVIEVDPESGKALSIKRIHERLNGKTKSGSS